ncbi:MAG: ABC transporter ATP-binding protein [Thermoanaerobaculia bacterium]
MPEARVGAPALELRGIVKRFPGGVIANDHIDLEVDGGEIRALLGENGAGKTTLMRVLYGLEPPDAGEIRLQGRRQQLRSPFDAIAAGLGMVHQHFMLFPSLTVAENVVFGREPTTHGLLDAAAANRRVAELSRRYGLEVDPRATVGPLPLGVRQRVEILKLLYRRAQVLILDEPTTVLTPAERERLFAVLRQLADEGKTVIFITHKLEEVMAVADRATVLRRGKVTATVPTAATSTRELCRLMVGRDLLPAVARRSRDPGEKEPVLRIEELTVTDGSGHRAVTGVSFEVGAGEIVGIAGVAGNGQSELVAAIAGLRPAPGGRVILAGRDVSGDSLGERRRQGLAYIPEDRNQVGLATAATIAENLLMGSTRRSELCRRGVLSGAGIEALASRIIDRFDIDGRPATTAAALSGGHRQRLVVARELELGTRLLIAEHPTQGIDVGTAERVLEWMAAFRDGGRGVLWVSAELTELLSLADRVLVMFEGRLVADRPAAELDEERLGLLMAGSQ